MTKFLTSTEYYYCPDYKKCFFVLRVAKKFLMTSILK